MQAQASPFFQSPESTLASLVGHQAQSLSSENLPSLYNSASNSVQKKILRNNPGYRRITQLVVSFLDHTHINQAFNLTHNL